MSFYRSNGILRIKTYTIKVCIKPDRSNSNNIQNLGIENIQIYYIGNVIDNGLTEGNKRILPDDVKLKDTGILTIDSNISGNFVLTQTIRSRFKQLEKTLGQSFQGFFYPQQNHTPSDWL